MATVQELEAQVEALKALLQEKQAAAPPAPATPHDALELSRLASQQVAIDGQRRDAQVQQTTLEINRAWAQSKPVPAFGLKPLKGGDGK